MNQKKRKENMIDRYYKQTSLKESDRSIDIIVRKKEKTSLHTKIIYRYLYE